MKKIILLIICIFFLTACYDYHELNEMSIIDGISFDYKDDEYVVSFEIIKSSNGEGDSGSISTNVVSAKDKVLANAINKTMNNTGKKVSFKHVRMFLISVDMAKKGIDEVIDYVIREVDMSMNVFTIICDDPKEVFDIKLENDSITSLIVDTITYNVDAKSYDNVDIIASNIMNKKIDIGLPFIKIEDKNVIVDEIAYFNNGNYIDKMSSKMYNFLVLDSNNIEFDYDNTVLNIYKKDISYEVNKDEIIINIKGYGKVKSVNEKYNLKETDVYKTIEEEINKTIVQESYDFLKETLTKDSDLIGLQDKYYRKYRKNKERINYIINSDIKLNRNGAIYEVLYD